MTFSHRVFATAVYHLSIWDVTKKTEHCIHNLFSNAQSHFYSKLSLCCEIFCSNHCFLNFDMLPYRWKAIRYQEASISSEICRKKVYSKHILVRQCIFNVAANQIYCTQERDIGIKPLSRLLVLFIFMLFCFEYMKKIQLQIKNLILYCRCISKY